jgi:sodium/potassium-transporting ATPase subunit alpha
MGVRVVVVTGDYSITAASIAKEVGILSEMKYDTYIRFRENISNKIGRRKAIILNGTDIDKIKKGEWQIICNEYGEIILSRATPKHKLLCVKEFQSNGYSVMMVGDGINDVPSLKRADLSVAMSSGSKLASLEAKVVLLNNSFDSVYELLLSGRQTLINIKKVFLFSIITNVFSQCFATLVSLAFLMPQLYSNLHMTIVSGLTDVLVSIFLFYEKIEPKDMKRCKEKVIDSRLLAHSLLFLAPLTTFFAYVNFFLYFKLFAGLNPSDLVFGNFVDDPDKQTILTAQTVGFYTIVVMQSFGNLYSIRTRYLSLAHSNPFARPYKNLGLIFTSIGIVLVLSIFLLFTINGLTARIPPIFYAISIGFSTFILVVNELRKTILKQFSTLRSYLYW